MHGKDWGSGSHPNTHLPQVSGPVHRGELGTDGQHAASAVPVPQAGTACTHCTAFLPCSGHAHRPAAAHGQCKGCRE